MYNVEGNFIANSMSEEESSSSKFFKEIMNLNWNFQREGGVQTNIWNIDFSETKFFRSKKRKCLLRN